MSVFFLIYTFLGLFWRDFLGIQICGPRPVLTGLGPRSFILKNWETGTAVPVFSSPSPVRLRLFAVYRTGPLNTNKKGETCPMFRRRSWISPLSSPILMNGIHGQYNYRTIISTCDQQLQNPKHVETCNEGTMHQTWGNHLHEHLDDSTSNQPVTWMPWTSTICPPMIEPIWWRKASASNAESLDTGQEIRSFIWNNNKAATLCCNDRPRKWKERSSTHMSDHS